MYTTRKSNSSLSVLYRYLVVASFMLMSQFVFAHGTQVGYCITTSGKIRVYIEHWHGNISPPQVVNALVVINITDSSTGAITSTMTVPNGVVWDTAVGDLPDCKGPLNVVSSCAGSANAYNDWVYWDFTPPSCFINLEIEVAAVVGSQSWYFDEACGSLYPVTFIDSFIDCVPPEIECPDDLVVEVNNSDCTANITGLEPEVLFDDCTDLADIVLAYELSGATTRSGLGSADGVFEKGLTKIEYTATDDTGKSSTCSFGVTVEDNNGPTMVCPSDLILECGDAGNTMLINDWLSSISATDFCGIAMVENDFASISSDEKTKQSVTFTATDLCGNTATCQATIIIDDKTDPVINCPADLTVECGAGNVDAVIDLWLEGATATDNCADNIAIINNYVNTFGGGCGPTGTRTVRFDADDGCGNTSFCTAVITMIDTTPPEFIMKPQDASAECINANGAAAARNTWRSNSGGAMAQDDCDNNVAISWELQGIVDGCGYTWTEEYLFTATDDCGNTSTATAFFEVVDTTPPVLNIPADRTVNCNQGVHQSQLQNSLDGASATDPCSDNALIDLVYVQTGFIPACGETGTAVYLFTATDECGNASTGYFNFTTDDENIPQVADCPDSITLECGDSNNPTIIAAWLDNGVASMGADVCHGVSVTHDFDGVYNEGCLSDTPVIFTATDDCGNQNSCTRFIRIRDRVNPIVVSCPEDLTVNVDVDNCSSNIIFSTPIFHDDCDDDLTVTQTLGLASGSTFPVGTTLIRFDARDDCNRLARCQFTITVEDSQLPSIACPSNDVVVCADLDGCTWISDDSVNPITNDNCDDTNIDYTVTGATTATGSNNVEGLVFEIGISEVCYEVADDEGNTADCCFNVVVEDCEDPSISCPADMTVECDGAGNAAQLSTWLSDASATDNCDVVTISSNVFNNISACGGGESIVYQFVATDDEGNEAYCYATFTIEDTTDPTIETDASDGVSNCDEADADLLDWLNSNGGAVATDLCGNVSWSNDFGDGAATDCSGVTSLSVTFTATDECGNTVETTALFNVDDTVPPVILCPEDITLECGDAANDAVINLWVLSASATDNCTTPIITNTYPSVYTADCADAGEYEITFTATDGCGNTSTCIANITIEDEVAPTFLMKPQDITVECDGEGNLSEINAWLSNNGGGMAQDECDTDVVWEAEQTGDGGDCGLTNEIEFEFIITDACGNENVANAFVVIEDSTSPELLVPGDLNVSCTSDFVTAKSVWLASASAFDDCSENIVVETELYNSVSACGTTKTEVYLFVASDECGNESTGLASFSLTDNIPPVMTCPEDLELECGAANNAQLIAAWLTTISATDDCGEVSFENNYTGLLPDNCGGELTVIFTGEDECGNSSQCTGTIIMNDVTIPDFVNCPEDLTINVDVDECGSNPIFSTPIAVDNCDVSVEQTAGPASGTSFDLGTTTIEFTATDACGNTQVCEFDITVIDSDDPLILCPSTSVNICTDVGTCTWTSSDIGPNIGVENCPDYTITYTISGATSASGDDDASGEILMLGTNTICYTIEDSSGNTSSCCFDVVVSDCEDPKIICPTDMTVECDGTGNSAALSTWLESITGTDNCDGVVSFTNQLYNEISACGGGGSKVYEFIASDLAGNTSVCYASFSIEDTVVPEIETAASNLTVECNGIESDDLAAWLNNNGGAVASDVCSALTWSNNYTGSLTNDCGDTGEITVIFTATDDCGNTNTTSAMFAIEDTIEPIITCPSGIVLECGDPLNDAVMENWFQSATATDACGVVTISYESEFDTTCGDAGEYTVTFTATDDCGNESTCESIIIIEDTILPVFDALPEDITIECADPNYEALVEAWLMNNGNGLASDLCGDVTWTVIALDPIPGCGDNENVPHQFTITDGCDNSISSIATVYTEDKTMPEIDLPDNMTVECDGAGNTAAREAWLASISGTDECGEVTTDYSLENTISGCGGTDTEVFLFVVTDDCGNQTTGQASFTIEDTTSPMISCPADLVLECGAVGNDQEINAWLVSAIGADICGSVLIEHNYTGLLPESCNGSLAVTFTAVDECGNTETCIANITMEDTTPPTFPNCPTADLNINVDVDNCDSNPIFSTPMADDNCDVTVTQTMGPASGATFDLGTTLVEFTATDACGNTATCQFNIVVIDTDEPIILCPSNTIVICTDAGECDWTSVDIGPSLGVENCPNYTVDYEITGATSATGTDDASGEILNLGLSTVCYTIEDTSGNSSICCFDILVEDCEDPSIDCPAPMTVECDGAGNAAQLTSWLALIEGTDNCDETLVFVSFVSNTISACGEGETFEYTFTATDDFGNVSTCISTFTIEDTTVPVIITPAANLTVECDGATNSAALTAWLNDQAGAVATDICSEPITWTHNYFGGLTADCGATAAVDVVFTATDECGNTSTTEATFIVEDTIDPVLACPVDITLECEDLANETIIDNWLASVSATDACSDVTITNSYPAELVSACGLTGVHTVTFTATDACGNTSTCAPTITIEDTTDPAIVTPAADLILECADPNNDDLIAMWEEAFGGAAASDACSTELSWSLEALDPIAACGDLTTTPYIFTVTDECGNTSTTSASVIIEDTTAPELTVPENQVEECADILVGVIAWRNEATASDLCGNVSISSVLWNTISGCGGTSTEQYLFTATDACGNATTGIASYEIIDTENPEVICPEDLILECGDPTNDQTIIAWLNSAVGTDDCGTIGGVAECQEEFVRVLPSDLGLTQGSNQSVTNVDISHLYSLPTGSILISITNVEVNAINNFFLGGGSPSDFTISGSMPVCVRAGHGEAITGGAGNYDGITSLDGVNYTLTTPLTNYTQGGVHPDYRVIRVGGNNDGNGPFIWESVGAGTAVEFNASSSGNSGIFLELKPVECPEIAEGFTQVNVTNNYSGIIPGDCNGEMPVEVIFTATDECGNTSTCIAMISMDDTEDPVFTNCPTNLTVNVDVDLCETNVVYSTPVALDNCDENVTVTLEEGPPSGSAFDLGTTTVTFMATDDCGNTSTCTFDITVIDSDVPSIDCPSNNVVVCTDPGSCTWLSDDQTDPLYNDNCDGIEVTYEITGATTASGDDALADDAIVFNIGSSLVSYTITDPSGNESTCSFVVVVEDCEAPTITCSDELDVVCGAEDVAAWQAAIAATVADNCNDVMDLNVVSTLITDFSSCGNTFEQTYLFTVTDEAGNSSTCIATYETDDEVPPVVTEASDLTLECNGGNQSTALQAWLNNNGGATATDACSEPIVWSNNFIGDIAEVCGTNGSTTVIFTATDDCGNTSTTSAVFTIEDTTAPELTCPNNITLECSDSINEAVIESWLTDVSAIDNCEGAVDVTNDYDENFEGDCGLTGVYTVIFTATDDCGNETTCTRTITLEDTTSPVVETEAQDLILECTDVANDMLIESWEMDFGMSEASDDCSDEPLTWIILSETELEGCGDLTSTIYVFQVTDNCGNTNTTSASVIIEDNTAPELILPENQVEECGDIITSLATWQAEATATDECGDVDIDVILWNTTSGCGGTNTETYLFTATDECGNQTTGLADYSSEDTAVPILNCPDDLAIVCGNENNDQIIAAWLKTASANDQNDCSEVTVSNSMPGDLPNPLDCASGTGILVTFTATDECGNTSTCTSTITMDDGEAPYFSNCPTNLTVNVDVDLCESNVVYSTPVALDNCDENVTVTLIEGPVSGTAFELGTTTVTFLATDDCGNTSTCTFDITVVDSDIPSIDCPSNNVVVCTDLGTCTWLSDSQTDPLFNDNCDGIEVLYEVTGATTADGSGTVSEDAIVFNLGTSFIKYTISDPAGNSFDCDFAVIVEDCENPTITCNDEFDIACGSENVDTWIANIQSSIADNCSDPANMTFNSTLITDFSSCGNTFEQTYLFRVTDENGNTATCLATYETDDDVAPVIDVEAENLTLECNGGNQSTALQAWLNNNAGASASDLCSGPISWTNDFVGDLGETCATNGTVEVIFTATDDCGNASTTTATFTIEDTTAPVLDCPQNLVLECGMELNDAVILNWANSATAIDACEGSVEVTHNYPDVFDDGCGLTGSYTVTFTAMDECGNTTSCDRTVSITDLTNPTITIEASDLLLECADPDNGLLIEDWENDFGGAEADDACSDETLTWIILSTTELQACGLNTEVIYVFQVTDNCGNTNTSSASVIISDTTPPVLNVPADQVEECADIETTLEDWLAEVTMSDECGEVTFESTLFNTISGCGDSHTEVYLFTATDDCGNQTTGLAEYQIIDTTVPIITKEAEAFTAECDGGSNTAEILAWLNNNGYSEASDTCGELVWSNDYGSVNGDCGTTGEIIVTFTATDDCGNSSSTSAVFTINDTTDPFWEILPQDLEIECDGSNDPMGQINAWLNTAGGADVEDDCSYVVFSNNFEDIDLECDQQGGVEVIFIATDACGNSSSQSANLSITDDVAPEITSPAKDETVECDGAGNLAQLQTWLDRNAGANSADACSPVLTWNYTLMSTDDTCGKTEAYTYMFNVTDACGNVSNNTIAIFTIEDTTAPQINGVYDTVAECDGSGNDAELQAWLDDHGGLYAIDDCSQTFTWEYDLISFEENCGITNVSTYRFTATDDCGNSSTAEATFTIEDTTVPAITPGADMSMEECDDPPLGNFPDFDYWLDSNAGAIATDDCGDLQWINNYHPDNWVFTCGNTRYIDVIFTAIDDCGNLNSTTHRFGVGDVTPPVFTNCPRPPVIVNAPDLWCSAYANFELPNAEDNCGGTVIVRRTDDLNLNSGDLFPVGTSILTYEAEDECGNVSSCELKIIVNDFHTEPEITCPEDISIFSDANLCGGIATGLEPTPIEENCPDNMCVIYQILDENGNIVANGTEDASGEYFPVGENTLEYAAIDQPILLITEIVQDDVSTGIEITNFGPASLDISCLDITRENPVTENYNVPNGTVLAPGAVYTQMFTDIPSGTAAGYYISYVGRIIDGVSINGYQGLNYSFSGGLFGESFHRLYIWDHDEDIDFELVDPCLPGSFGELNPSLPICPPNGTTVGMQEGEAGVVYCNSTVTVIDNVAPFCAQYDTMYYELLVPVEIVDGCTTINFDVSDDMAVGDVRLMDLQLDLTNAEDLLASLSSPDGTSVILFGGSCPGTSSVTASFADGAGGTMGTILCDPPGAGHMYQPMQSFKTFFNESAQGTWSLEISDKGLDEGFIIEATLEILTLVPFAQEDMVMENDRDECGAFFSWPHPMFSDNCCFGEMSFSFESEDAEMPPLSVGDFAQGSMTGTMFGVGTTTVIYTSIDQFGNESICSFDVTVEDTQAPAFRPEDCQDRYFQLPPGGCAIPMNELFFLTTAANDNCDDVDLRITPDYQGGIPIGNHTFTMIMSDRFGNESECTFEVVVEPFNVTGSGDAIVCVGNINLSLGPDCTATVTPDMVLSDAVSYGCSEDFCVRLTDEFGNDIGSSESGTNVLTEEHVGQTILAEICIDCEESNCCWAYINVENKLIPEVVCPDDITISCNQTYDISATGEPVVETCEQEIYFNYEDELVTNGMCQDPAATLVRTWYITDESGNTITCNQNIHIKQFYLGDVVMPEDFVVTEFYSCQDVVNDPTLTHPDHTGYPTIEGVPIFETGDGLCSHFWNWDDLQLMNCDGSYEILRRWVIHDMCEEVDFHENPIEHYQIIKVLDTTPPVFEDCPEDLTVNAGTSNCAADIYLNDYMPIIYDECGSVEDLFVTVNPGTVYESPANSGNYYLTNLVPGEHRVRIRAKDQCSNYSNCEFTVHVEDLDEPNVICESDIIVSLSNSGQAKLQAEVLDDGSFDYCTDVFFQIYRMNEFCVDDADLVPGPHVTLCCEDVARSPIMVVLRVWDDADGDGTYGSIGDHFGECMVEVVVQDKTIPELQCPPDIDLVCGQDYTDLSVTGMPSVGFVCNTVEATYVDELNDLEDCNIGQVVRRWTIPTPDGPVECNQIITITSPDTFDESDIVWAPDWEGDCNTPQDNFVPQFVGAGECDQLGIQLESDTFYLVDDACFKVINYWKVRNWCTGEEYTDQQVLKFVDDTPPVITVADANFISDQDCEAMVELMASADDAGSACPSDNISWIVRVDLENNGTFDYQFSGYLPSDDNDFDDTDGDGVGDIYLSNTSGGEQAVISLPEAVLVSATEHRVVWTADDGCGNTTTQTSYFNVADQKPPNAVCINLSSGFMVNGELTLWACDFDASSSDNCTATENLLFGFTEVHPTLDPDFNPLSGCTSRTFTCEDYEASNNGLIDVPIYVWDESGNYSICEAQINLIDNSDACDGTVVPMIAGRITTPSGDELVEAKVTLMDITNNPMDDTQTGEDGRYSFENISFGNDYKVGAHKDTLYLNGITTLDVILIQKHIIATQKMENPYQLIAADITNDERITGTDIIKVRKLILGIEAEFPNNDSWRFVDINDEMTTSTVWPFTEVVNLYDLPASNMAVNFVGVKIGDVNFTAIPNLVGPMISEVRGNDALIWSFENRSFIPGEEFDVVFTADANMPIEGFQFTLQHPGLEMIEINSDNAYWDKDYYGIFEDKSTVSWNDPEANAWTNENTFVVSFKANEFGSLAERLKMDSEITFAEAYDNQGNAVMDNKLTPSFTPFVLKQNTPNPFTESTLVSFTLPDNGEAKINIFDNQGKLIFSRIADYEAGLNKLILSKNDIGGATGLLTLKMDYLEESQTIKLISIN